ncbi:MAG: hypothetical protein Alpg2KO_17090 [Alphaproteobacteria bacterium]
MDERAAFRACIEVGMSQKTEEGLIFTPYPLQFGTRLPCWNEKLSTLGPADWGGSFAAAYPQIVDPSNILNDELGHTLFWFCDFPRSTEFPNDSNRERLQKLDRSCRTDVFSPMEGVMAQYLLMAPATTPRTMWMPLHKWVQTKIEQFHVEQ